MTTQVRNIQSTPMAPYASLMDGMSKEDKLTVVAFLMGTMQHADDRTHFYSCLEQWEKDTRFLSSVTAITQHPCFQAIVAMGGNAVPYIVEEIERRPSKLVWALNAIFHKRIGTGETITEACRLWIAELKKS